MNKKAYVETILNNGAVPAEGMVPAKFAKSPEGNDFRKENGNLVKDDVKTSSVTRFPEFQELLPTVWVAIIVTPVRE